MQSIEFIGTISDMDFGTLFWLIFGCTLIVAELLLPGGIAFFLGTGALFVAVLHIFGQIDSPLTGFTIWFILSIILLFTLKGVVEKFIPHIKSKGNVDLDLDAFGEVVDVTEEISYESVGRVEYLGSTWPARTKHPDAILKPGSKAKLIFKDNLTWLVEPVTDENP